MSTLLFLSLLCASCTATYTSALSSHCIPHFPPLKAFFKLHFTILQSPLTPTLRGDTCPVVQLEDTLQHSMPLVLFLQTSCSTNLEIVSFSRQPSPKFSSFLFWFSTKAHCKFLLSLHHLIWQLWNLIVRINYYIIYRLLHFNNFLVLIESYKVICWAVLKPHLSPPVNNLSRRTHTFRQLS